MNRRRKYLANFRSRAEIAAAIKTLPMKFQIALALLYCDDLNISEIAAVMRLTERKTRSILKMAHEMVGFSSAKKSA